MNSHQGKSYVITGGSRGIGAGIATHLADEGARVCITYSSRPDSAEAVLSKLKGEDHLSVQLKLEDESSVNEAFKTIFNTFGTIDGLVNNAGITSDQILLRMKSDEFKKVINTNLNGTFLCTKAALRPMLKAKAGSIVNITSVIGQTGNAGQANYAASKAGIEAFTKSVAQEVASRNIRLNCVAPGFIETEMTDILTPEQKQEIFAQIPMKQLGEVLDIAQAVSFLLSNKSKYMTGQTISINGGLFM